MLLQLVKPILEVLHLLHWLVFFIYTASYLIGRGIIIGAVYIWKTVQDISSAMDIIGEEFHVFIHDLRDKLDSISNCITTATFSALNGILEAALCCFEYVSNGRFLFIRIGRFLNEYGFLLKDALLLILDCMYWILQLGPKAISFGADTILCLLTMAIEFLHIMITKSISLLYGLTVTVPVAYVCWRNRHRIIFYIIRYVKLIFRYSFVPLKQFVECKRLFSKRLYTDSFRRPTVKDLPVNGLCIACMENQKCVLFLPCRHLCFCNPCAMRYILDPTDTCPLCRSKFTSSLTIYT